MVKTEWAKREDENQPAIREACRKAGYYWIDTFRFGAGFPDAIVFSKTKIPVFFEIKMPAALLTKPEREFCATFPGYYHVVRSVDDAIFILQHVDQMEIVCKDDSGWLP
jgi:hypothetical protein